MTRTEAITFLKLRQGDRTLRAYAEHLGVSAAYLSDIFLGRRDPGPKVGFKKHRSVQCTFTHIKPVRKGTIKSA